MEIKITNLSKAYRGKNYVLKEINLDLKTPALIGLVGPNGAGKTTLMRLLVSQILPSQGEITVDGYNLFKNQHYLKERLGYLPQDFGLYDELTVEQFLDYIACLKGSKANRKKVINDAIGRTNLDGKRRARIKTLSGGQKQRVGIAQAMLNDPELFIVDEPTVGLDPEERIKFRNLFSENASNKIVILSTHIIDDVESICNRLIVMDHGIILYDGTPTELVQKTVNHVAVVELTGVEQMITEGQYRVVSRLVSPTGVRYRLVGDDLPRSSKLITPTLEDAYVYCMMKGGF